jgi:hypothetical protein
VRQVTAPSRSCNFERPGGSSFFNRRAANGCARPPSLPQPPSPKTAAGATVGRANRYLHSYIVIMQERFSETVSERKERLEAAISEALQRKADRHDAAVKNLHRLRALRLERDQKAEAP